MTLQTYAIYLAAAVAEIAGCFAVWNWARLGGSMLGFAPGLLSLEAFAWRLTRQKVDFVGCAYAAYDQDDIVTSRLRLWSLTGERPDGGDLAGAYGARVPRRVDHHRTYQGSGGLLGEAHRLRRAGAGHADRPVKAASPAAKPIDDQ